jgi:hypothetical protein
MKRCSYCGTFYDFDCFNCRPVPNTKSVPNAELVPNIKKGDAQRVAKWKVANKEKDRAYHRELMRKRRAAGK